MSIPYALIEEWTKLSEGAEIDGALRRQDIDNLFFAMDKQIHASDGLRLAMAHFVNGSIAEGNEALAAAQRNIIESQNRLRQFMTGIMVAATRKADP